MACWQLPTKSDFLREMVWHLVRQALQHVEHKAPLDLRRHAAGLLVHRDDASGVNRLPFFYLEDFVLWVGELQAAIGAHVDRSVEHDALTGGEHVAQKRLVEPDRAEWS